MRTDRAAPVLAELAALSAEHDEITELLWHKMVRVAVIETRQLDLVNELALIRHGVMADR